MNKTKQERYDQLVKKRKDYRFKGLKNPNEIENGVYDTGNAINPWSLWQGNLDAEILVIGQDWGNDIYYIQNKGRDTDDNPTNRNLKELFASINIDIGTPNHPDPSASVFLTNAILGIKPGNMSARVKASWVNESTEEFLKPLIEIIEPRIIITLGVHAYKAIKKTYKLKEKAKLSERSRSNPISVENKELFAFYHCGSLGTANRSLNQQKADWSAIK